MSFHTVTADSPHHWDAIRDLPAGFIAAQNPLPGVPRERWAQNVSATWYDTGQEMANAIAAGLDRPEGPVKIMIDELRGDSIAKVADCARMMRAWRPELAGRWGCYVVNGERVSYAGLQPAIDELLDARAMIACELYASQDRYEAAGEVRWKRDVWLGDFFRGSRGAFPQPRLHWLVEQRKARGSDSHISVLFGVIDRFVSDAEYLDRMFYVFVTRSGYRSIALASNGGVGSWKWDREALGSSARDSRFATSWDWYCLQEKIRLCP